MAAHLVRTRAVVTLSGRDPDWDLVDAFNALPERWQAEVLLVIAKRRPGLLDEALGDVEAYRRTSSDLIGRTP